MLSRDEYVLPGVMVDFFGLNQLEAIRKRLIYGLGNVSNVARKANGGYLGTASSGFIPNFQNSTGNSSLTASLQNVTASFNKESIILLSEYMSQNTADAVYNATKRGLNDGRKRFEREQYSERIAKR
jgi:hypothetical protein